MRIPSSLVLLAIIGFVSQLIDGALGMAYGATSSTLAVAVGLSPAVASATVHLSEIGTTVASGAAHWRFGNVDWRTVARIGFPGAVGAFVGAVVLSSVSTELARPWMGGVLFVVGLYILYRFTIGRAPRPNTRPIRARFLAILGLGAGFVDASGGGGWGPIATPTLLASGRMAPRKVVGSVDTSEFLVALAASAGFLLSLGRSGINWPILFALLGGGLVAAPLAAWLVRRFSPRLLGASVAGLILITNARTVMNTLGTPAEVRVFIYAVLVTAAIAGVAYVVSLHRRAGVSLTSETWVARGAGSGLVAGD